MARISGAPSREILEAALQGLESQRERLDEQISEVRSMLGSRGPGRPPASAKKATSNAGSDEKPSGRRGKRVLSPEARKRIAAAQKKRWAAFRKKQA